MKRIRRSRSRRIRNSREKAPAWRWVAIGLLAVLFGTGVYVEHIRGSHKDADLATFLVTATANEPTPLLSMNMTRDLTSIASHDDGEILFLHPDQGRAVPGTSVKLTPMRDSLHKETNPDLAASKTNDNIQTASQVLNKIHSSNPGLDLLTGLVAAGDQHERRTIYVLSSGLSTVAPLDFRKLGWGFSTDVVIQDLRRQGNLPNLHGHDIIFSGLGLTAGRQPPLTVPERRKVTDFWTTLCFDSGGQCTVDDSAADSGAAPNGDAPTWIVPIDPPCTYSRSPGHTTLSLSDSLLGFAGNSTVLPANGDRVLKPIAAAIKAGDHVHIVGHTANYQSLSGQYTTSRGRALAVLARLRQLGASPSAVFTIDGVGPDDPVPNVPATDPSNRRVTLDSTHALMAASACLRS